ncbi:MAG: glycosyltransferase family 2 protein [Magnetococcales bacterium]|nr:glycosyltransferase family 2 protein [Magnetococcales bacterium]
MQKLISVVIPIFNEVGNIDPLLDRLARVADGLPYRFEFVFVDDGSRDGSLESLLRRQFTDNRVVVVSLSRNWGHQNAFNAGLEVARGDALILMDGDLEDPPELIPQLIARWNEGRFKVVTTVKESRSQSGLRRLLTRFYYFLIRHLTKSDLDNQSGMFSLIDRRIADHLFGMKERNKSYPNLRSFLGYSRAAIAYHRPPRGAGAPKQTLLHLINDGLNAIFSFSFLPIRVISVVGLLLTSFFLVIGAVTFIVRVTDTRFWIFYPLPGFSLTLLLQLLIASFQILFLGILGEYLARIYDDIRQRPNYIIETVYRQPGEGSGMNPDATRSEPDAATGDRHDTPTQQPDQA